MLSRALTILTMSACASAGSSATVDASGNKIDAPETPHDDAPVTHPDGAMPTIDGAVTQTGTHLVLSEICLAPTPNELIEVANPTNQTIDLSKYYLSDNGTYWKLPGALAQLDSGDFIARFPNGATIAPGGVVTVALDTTANFTTAYGAAPTYSIASGTMTVVQMSGTPSLTNGGELVALFYYDSQSDNVKDVDLMIAGQATAANGLVNKSGMPSDGPDAGTSPTNYQTDANTLVAQTATPGNVLSTKRIMLEANHETQAAGGNGITGDDETSEDTSVTWDTTFTAPNPGTVSF